MYNVFGWRVWFMLRKLSLTCFRKFVNVKLACILSLSEFCGSYEWLCRTFSHSVCLLGALSFAVFDSTSRFSLLYECFPGLLCTSFSCFIVTCEQVTMATAPHSSLHMRSTDLIKKEPLDYGGFGEVYLCYHVTLGQVVLKTIYTGPLRNEWVVCVCVVVWSLPGIPRQPDGNLSHVSGCTLQAPHTTQSNSCLFLFTLLTGYRKQI